MRKHVVKKAPRILLEYDLIKSLWDYTNRDTANLNGRDGDRMK